ncbi:hypothetical protein C7S20_19410 [Christiangramia fulva]|uniref:Uncharacterized protein n=1 Tax=Christiangramia fulva TaxID=2126553 RepID=A0A2R3ZAJ5_9FLAO|nr:terminase small subunit [Christiangramia fulva]AVR47244.1 hypothetical protein C7S20_19410 [Christiangramia fulva]
MAFEEGNTYYQIRSKHGRDTEYTPDTLLEKANEYFQWVLDNPLQEEQIIKGRWTEEKSQKVPDGKGGFKMMKLKTTHPYARVKVPKMRPFTLEGFCNYAEIVVNTFKNYEKKEIDPDSSEEEQQEVRDFLTVTRAIRQIIDNQQFEGAASGFLNHNIIARKLGLSDHKILAGDPEKPLGIPKQTIVIKERTLEEE